MQTAQTKYSEVLSVAQDLFRQAPDWVTYFREVLGINGIIRQAFPEYSDLSEFECSREYEEIQKMLTKLRAKRIGADCDTETTRVITVRLPKSMHEFLRHEAGERKTSMNKLCISKLLQVIDNEMIPKEKKSARKRRSTVNRMQATSQTQIPTASTPSSASQPLKSFNPPTPSTTPAPVNLNSPFIKRNNR